MYTEQPIPAEMSMIYSITTPSTLEIGTARKIAVFPFVTAPGAIDKSCLIIICPSSDKIIRSWSTTGATLTKIGR